jgi:hypothetical protein
VSLLRDLHTAPDEYLARFVRWARRSDDLRGVPLSEVPRDELIDEAEWQADPHQDRGMYG